MSVTITNKMKRMWFIPPAGNVVNAVPVDPGASAVIDDAHWDAVRKGNAVIDALLAGRHITAGARASAVDELSNPASPAPSDDIKSPVVDAKGNELETSKKIDVKEISLGDEPMEVTRRGRKPSAE